MRFGVFDIGDWSEGEILVDKLFDDWVLFAECDVHLNGSLTVSDVVHFLVGD